LLLNSKATSPQKKLLAGGRGDEMARREIIYQEVNESRLTINLIKYRGREKKRPFVIDFKAFAFFFVCVNYFLLTESDYAKSAIDDLDEASVKPYSPCYIPRKAKF
jgi:hypothetical protein